MGTIVAIGGGEIGRSGKPGETLALDRTIVSLAGATRPRLLFIPTASGDSSEYLAAVEQEFGGRLGCEVRHLCLIREALTTEQVRSRVLASDIVYVGGGNTLRMMMVWRRHGVDIALAEAWERGVVLSGLSAGANCWFRQGLSRASRRTSRGVVRVTGLGLIKALCCPHYNADPGQRNVLAEVMRRTPGPAVALDDRCALLVRDGGYRVIATSPEARAYCVRWRRGRLHEAELEQVSEARPLSDLLG
jgi:dipeptidase E